MAFSELCPFTSPRLRMLFSEARLANLIWSFFECYATRSMSKRRFILPGKINGFMMLVMTPFSLPPGGLPVLCVVMTSHSSDVISLPSRRLKKASC